MLSLVSGCASLRPRYDRPATSVHRLEKLLGPEQIFARHQGDSPFVVALIPEFHHLGNCQLDVYDTLETLRPRTAFVAIEGRVGDVEHEELARTYAPGVDDDFSDLLTPSLDERRRVVDRWQRAGAVPKDASRMPVAGALLHEAVFQDEVLSKGLESPEVLARALQTASTYERMNAIALMPKTTVIGARNRIFARKLRYYGTVLSGPTADIIPFPIGAAHVDDLGRKLRRKGISYVVLFNDSCLPPDLIRVR